MIDFLEIKVGTWVDITSLRLVNSFAHCIIVDFWEKRGFAKCFITKDDTFSEVEEDLIDPELNEFYTWNEWGIKFISKEQLLQCLSKMYRKEVKDVKIVPMANKYTVTYNEKREYLILRVFNNTDDLVWEYITDNYRTRHSIIEQLTLIKKGKSPFRYTQYCNYFIPNNYNQYILQKEKSEKHYLFADEKGIYNREYMTDWVKNMLEITNDKVLLI